MYADTVAEKLGTLTKARADFLWIVEGAGDSLVNGAYTRTGQICNNCDVFRKKGSPFVLMRRGREGWSLNDLGGAATEKWSLKTVELYRSVNMQGGLVPPLFGWAAADGTPPAPFLRRANLVEAQEDVLLQTRSFGRRPKRDVLRSRSESLLTNSNASALPHLEKRKEAKSLADNFLRASMAALKLPQLSSQPPVAPEPSETTDNVLCFRIVLWRPSALMPWGMTWVTDAFHTNGARIVSSVVSGSPLERWNVWQRIRGRDGLCVRLGDRLLKTDGNWSFCDSEVAPRDGDLGACAVENAKLEDETGGCITLEFGRPVQRPGKPRPPKVSCDPDAAVLQIVLASDDDELPEIVYGFALCVKDVSTGIWSVIDGNSLVAQQIVPGSEHNAFSPDVLQVSLWKGLVPGRKYVACHALLTERGWSSLSEESNRIQLVAIGNLEKFWLYQQGLAAPTLDSEWKERPRFCMPTSVRPASTAPVELTAGPRELMGSRYLLRLQAEFRGDVTGLRLRPSKNGRVLTVLGHTPGSATHKWHEDHTAESRTVQLHGFQVVVALRPGDRIVRVNGIIGVEAMLKEIERNSGLFLFWFERFIGTSESEAASTVHVLRLEEHLDGEAARLVEEVEYNNLSDVEEGALIYAMLDNSTRKLEEMIYAAAWAAQFRQKASVDLIREAQDRLILLRRRIECDSDLPEDTAMTNLKTVLADIDQDPEAMTTALAKFENVSRAVQESKPAQQWVRRVEGMRALLEWRANAARQRRMLQASLKACVEKEFQEGEGSPTNEVDPGEHLAKRFQTDLLAENLEAARAYACHMNHDLFEAEAVLQRHYEKQEQARQRKQRRLELLAMSNPGAKTESSDEEEIF